MCLGKLVSVIFYLRRWTGPLGAGETSGLISGPNEALVGNNCQALDHGIGHGSDHRSPSACRRLERHRLVHVGLDLRRAQGAIVDPNLIDQAIEVARVAAIPIVPAQVERLRVLLHRADGGGGRTLGDPIDVDRHLGSTVPHVLVDEGHVLPARGVQRGAGEQRRAALFILEHLYLNHTRAFVIACRQHVPAIRRSHGRTLLGQDGPAVGEILRIDPRFQRHGGGQVE